MIRGTWAEYICIAYLSKNLYPHIKNISKMEQQKPSRPIKGSGLRDTSPSEVGR